uniref:RING-type E3 ubiquitin transferase n=1 Tax=Rousettus aegyptiacus TaxID=9407 RepID=A0A7J8BHV1_ROUAE|nr:tripartite motif containing 45 [Rousettus aegyptiacus]
MVTLAKLCRSLPALLLSSHRSQRTPTTPPPALGLVRPLPPEWTAKMRQKKTTHHTMVDLKDLKGYSRIAKAILCPAHPAEELRLFCELCDRPVCRDCVVGEHREHPYDFASNVIHKHGDSVRELLRGTQPHVGALEDALAQVREMNSALQEQVEAVAADVRTFSEGYIKAIEEHRDKLLKQLEDIRVQKENSLQLQKAQLEQLLADMRTGVDFTEHLLTSGSDLEILITKGVVVERLTTLNRVAYNARPGVSERICFSPQEKAGRCRGYEVYGVIKTKEVDPAKCVLQGEDLHRAREKQTVSFTVLCKDAAGESMDRGGDNVQVVVVPRDKKDRSPCSPVRTTVQDNKDGTYYVSYTPREPGIYTVLVCVKEQHVQGSPFTVTVRKRHRSHPGVFHCCTFCSSGGQKTARCACGGTMPGGYLGCGHGHRGHPGRPHWSCCGKFTEKAECTWTGGQSTARSVLRTVAL